MERIGFIGCGVMGQSMASHLLDAGYPVSIYSRTKSKAEALIEKGAQWCDESSTLARQSEVIITIVGYPKDVEEVYLSPDGVLKHANESSLFIDMTTSKPALARRIYEEAKAQGIDALDAPVSGGDIGAREARLSIMVGGDKSAFEKAKPIFEVMGKNIVLQGPAGSGQHTKMANQIAIASNMMGVCEAMVYAENAGLTPQTVLESIEQGAAGSWSLSNLAPRMVKGDFSPGFFVKHFIKDMGIALEEASSMGMSTPGLKLAHELYEKFSDSGGSEKGTQALYELYKSLPG